MSGDELTKIREAMATRGPDGAGTWIPPHGRVGLAHRRLAIIDLSTNGAQPMIATDGQTALVFNGEIYNFKALKNNLEAKGHRFRSESDSEVILALYREHGQDLVHHLRGMFAFAIWDEAKQGLFLARDPLGIKPLYTSNDGKSFRFASQVKALLRGGAVDPTLSSVGMAGFYLMGFIPEPHTTHRSIQALPAGHTQWIDNQGPRPPVAFFSIRQTLAEAEDLSFQSSIPTREVKERLRAAFLDSAEHHLVSDVPVGIFLSSGLDSSTLVSLTRELGVKDIRTLTLGFREFEGTHEDETRSAAEVANHFGTSHETRWVSNQEFEAELPRAFDCMDQPSIDGLNTYFICKVAAQAGLKVALSGLGGDELFGGYPSFQQVPKLAKWSAPFANIPGLPRAFRTLSRPFTGQRISPKWASIFEYGGSIAGAYLLRRGLFMPWELKDRDDSIDFEEGIQELDLLARMNATISGLKSDHARVMALEMTWFMGYQLLKDSDWASMAHGLELRVPMADAHLLKRIGPLILGPTPANKHSLAESLNLPLPAAILNRPKTGFSMPLHAWTEQIAGTGKGQRGRRGWAHLIAQKSLPEFSSPPRKKVLLLTSDGFGGHGGIALYNRDLMNALASLPQVSKIVGIPRLMPKSAEPIQSRIFWDTRGLGGKPQFTWAAMRHLFPRKKFDLVICGLINLAPLAVLASWVCRSPAVLLIYGIDAWKPHKSLLVRWAIRHMDSVISISKVTLDRFQTWSEVPGERCQLLPNAIHLESYSQGPKPEALLKRYGIPDDSIILMTFGRMASHERYKGFDEIIELLPELKKRHPGLIYIAAGEGPDRARLEEKVQRLGVQDSVVFTGMVEESEKADHYRLADAYVMPSRGEGFGFVLLEAMACGIPVVASELDGTREAVRNGAIGFVVNPDHPESILQGIEAALAQRPGIPEGLSFFAFPSFQAKLKDITAPLLESSRP